MTAKFSLKTRLQYGAWFVGVQLTVRGLHGFCWVVTLRDWITLQVVYIPAFVVVVRQCVFL